MWLLNTLTKKLQEFDGPEQVQYAILSHRWLEDEVTFEDIRDPSPCFKKGASKVNSFCNVSRERGFDWCWIDTCCINKASSAELSESINSMYSWYHQASFCAVYLHDVSAFEPESEQFESEFRASTWFLRSWTLQELLASAQHETVYYNTDWQFIGSNTSLSTLVAEITKIDKAAILGQRTLNGYSIAERMSWASMRSATRVEDIAYSLLGIFDIQMPLVYGEGLKAFRRLQQAIMLTSDDETIFAWEPTTHGDIGLLARSPACFAAGHYLRQAKPQSGAGRHSYELMSRGVRFNFASYHRVDEQIDILLLNVMKEKLGQTKQQVGIYVRNTRFQNEYHRIYVASDDQLWHGPVGPLHDNETAGKTFYISFDHRESSTHHLEPRQPMELPKYSLSNQSSIQDLEPPAYSPPSISTRKGYGYDLCFVPGQMIRQADQTIMKQGMLVLSNSKDGGPICNILFNPPYRGVNLIHLGVDTGRGRPVCTIIPESDDGTQSYALVKQFANSICDLSIDYSSIKPIERQILPDRVNGNSDWHIQIWPPTYPMKEISWYKNKLWQHPKLQPDNNYFIPFPFDFKRAHDRRGNPVPKYEGCGIELLEISRGKWRLGLTKYLVVCSWAVGIGNSSISKIMTGRPQSLAETTYSIDLDTFKSVKTFSV